MSLSKITVSNDQSTDSITISDYSKESYPVGSFSSNVKHITIVNLRESLERGFIPRGTKLTLRDIKTREIGFVPVGTDFTISPPGKRGSTWDITFSRIKPTTRMVSYHHMGSIYSNHDNNFVICLDRLFETVYNPNGIKGLAEYVNYTEPAEYLYVALFFTNVRKAPTPDCISNFI